MWIGFGGMAQNDEDIRVAHTGSIAARKGAKDANFFDGIVLAPD